MQNQFQLYSTITQSPKVYLSDEKKKILKYEDWINICEKFKLIEWSE